MIEVLIWLVVGGLLVHVILSDWRTGETSLSRLGGGATRTQAMLRRSEYPFLFAAVLVVKFFAGIMLILALTGRLLPLIQIGA